MIKRNVLNTGAVVILVLLVTGFTTINTKKIISGTGTAGADNGFAVLELFTSEGCSSCPKADQLLGEIQIQSIDKPVYILAYHVDYWDHQGWKDIFSSAENTKRQREYSSRLNSTVYTPQLVINGTTEVVGSDEPAIDKALNDALARVKPAGLSIKSSKKSKTIDIEYHVSDGFDQANLVIALVQKHAIRKVKRGENEGRTLTHFQIVREFQKIALSAAPHGTTTLNLPDGFDEQQWEVIAFVQKKMTGEITSAVRENL